MTTLTLLHVVRTEWELVNLTSGAVVAVEDQEEARGLASTVGALSGSCGLSAPRLALREVAVWSDGARRVVSERVMGQGGLPNSVWRDKRVQDYMRNERYGYLHHGVRSQQADARLVEAMEGLAYTHEEQVGLLIGKMGRLAGDTLEEEPERLTLFLEKPHTRSWCREVAAEVEAEYGTTQEGSS